MSIKRIFLFVLDSLGIGEMPDAKDFGDEGSNTLLAISKSDKFDISVLKNMGMFNIDGVKDNLDGVFMPTAAFGRFEESSMGKDTTIGHWEISGIISPKPLPTYPNGFPKEVIDEFEKRTGRKVLCNKPYSGTEVIKVYGKEHMQTGALIVYTSADSVFQIAAHEDIVPPEKLYEYCRIAREILTGEHSVGRVIARPFIGTDGNFTRTTNRHDFSLTPPKPTMLDYLKDSGFDVIAVGKISDIFAGRGVTEKILTKGNADGMAKAMDCVGRDFNGLCFINLVDFDMLYGHRNNVDGYANALTEFDKWLPQFTSKMNNDDVLMITSDHGCDPSTPSTNHSREHTFLIMYGNSIKSVNLGTRKTFSDIGKSILDIFGIDNNLDGTSFADLTVIK